MFKRVLPIPIAFFCALSSAAAYAQDNQPATINISASGAATAAPDMATVTSGVVTQGETARQALSANNEAMSALIDVLEDAGIETLHIQTSGFSVQPIMCTPTNVTKTVTCCHRKSTAIAFQIW